MWVLEIEPRSFGRAASAINKQANKQMYVYIHFKTVSHVHAWCCQRSEEGVGVPANGVMDGCELPSRDDLKLLICLYLPHKYRDYRFLLSHQANNKSLNLNQISTGHVIYYNRENV